MLKQKLVVIAILTILTMACAKHAVQAPVPGQLNTFDAYAYRVLADSQAALNSFKADVTSGKLVPSPTFKTVLNQAIADYNAANSVYQAWHAAGGTGSTQQLSQQINQVSTDIGTLGGQR
jgi:hypothetical protein